MATTTRPPNIPEDFEFPERLFSTDETRHRFLLKNEIRVGVYVGIDENTINEKTGLPEKCLLLDTYPATTSWDRKFIRLPCGGHETLTSVDDTIRFGGRKEFTFTRKRNQFTNAALTDGPWKSPRFPGVTWTHHSFGIVPFPLFDLILALGTGKDLQMVSCPDEESGVATNEGDVPAGSQ